MRRLLLSLITTGTLALTAMTASAAVMLQQQWQEGQQLTYNTNIDGKLGMQLPADVPIMIAGMPLEINVRAAGKTILDTKSVNDFGDGTVQIKIDPLSIEGESFGQKALIQVKNGKATMSLNGSRQDSSFVDWNLLSNPPVTLTFSPRIKVTNFAVLSSKEPVAAGAAMPVNMLAMVQNIILQSLPAMLPGKSVDEGEEWTSDVQIKMSPAPDAPTLKIGTFTFQLKGALDVGGRSLQHITVKGSLDLGAEQSRALAAAFSNATSNINLPANAGSMANVLSNRVLSFSQSMNGDLYFDTLEGHFTQANLNINAKANTLPREAGAKTADGFMNFNDNLRYRLTGK